MHLIAIRYTIWYTNEIISLEIHVSLLEWSHFDQWGDNSYMYIYLENRHSIMPTSRKSRHFRSHDSWWAWLNGVAGRIWQSGSSKCRFFPDPIFKVLLYCCISHSKWICRDTLIWYEVKTTDYINKKLYCTHNKWQICTVVSVHTIFNGGEKEWIRVSHASQ